MKIAIEAHRRAMPYCMGTLYWQLNDCWPGASWSGRDYDGRWKALQYYVKEAFNPQLVSSVIENNQLATYVVTDNVLGPADLEMTAIDITGKVIWHKELKGLELKSNTSEKVHTLDTAAMLQGNNPARVIFYAQLRIHNKFAGRNIFYFAPAKEMPLETPHLDVATSKAPNDEGVVLIRVKTDKLARNVYLSLDKPAPADRFEENYFDLLPGESKTIRLRTRQMPELIHQALKVTTLIESYKN